MVLLLQLPKCWAYLHMTYSRTNSVFMCEANVFIFVIALQEMFRAWFILFYFGLLSYLLFGWWQMVLDIMINSMKYLSTKSLTLWYVWISFLGLMRWCSKMWKSKHPQSTGLDAWHQRWAAFWRLQDRTLLRFFTFSCLPVIPDIPLILIQNWLGVLAGHVKEMELLYLKIRYCTAGEMGQQIRVFLLFQRAWVQLLTLGNSQYL